MIVKLLQAKRNSGTFPVIKRGGRFLHLACNSGAWGIAALHIAEASYCLFTDIDVMSVYTVYQNAQLNSVPDGSFDVAAGDFLEPVRRGAFGKFDTIFMDPPQMPMPQDYATTFSSKYAGPDGTDFFMNLAKEASSLLENSGRIVILITTLCNISKVKEAFEKQSWAFETIRVQQREFTKAELESKWGENLYPHLEKQRQAGLIEFEEVEGVYKYYARLVQMYDES